METKIQGPVTIDGDVTVNGSYTQTGQLNPFITGHDAFYWWGRDFFGSAGLVDNAGTDALPPYWAFDASTIERVKFMWTPPLGWEAYVGRIAFFTPGIPDGNVAWRWKHEIIELGGGVGTAPAIVGEETVAAPAALGSAWTYMDLAGSVASPIPLTGGVVNIVIDRNATADTMTSDVALFLATITRVDV